MSRLRIDVVSIFPDYLAPLSLSLVGRAVAAGLIEVRVHDLRAWGRGAHSSVDDTSYGGGPGMVMRPDVWGDALDAVTADRTHGPADAVSGDPPGVERPLLVVPGPTGEPLTQTMAAELSRCSWLVFACGRYEGIDARVVEEARRTFDVREISLGDYVLAGGEVAALVVIEAVTRLLPGVLGNDASADDDSFAAGPMAAFLEGPVFTKPRSWRGHHVPPLLLAGDHERVRRWRRDEAIRRTALVRPDLLSQLDPGACDDDDLLVLAELGWTAVGKGFSRAEDPVAD